MIHFKNNKCGQGITEFILIAGLLILVVTGIIFIVHNSTVSSRNQKVLSQAEDVGNIISSEVLNAYSSVGDYSREFILPETIDEMDYVIKLDNNSEISIIVNDLEYVVFLDYNVSGSIKKGKNQIKKTGEDDIIIN